MVQPVRPEERAAFARKVKFVITLVVGASAGLVALQTGATPVQAGVAAGAALPVGAAVAWFVVPGATTADRRYGRAHSHRTDGSGSADAEEGHRRSTGNRSRDE